MGLYFPQIIMSEAAIVLHLAGSGRLILKPKMDLKVNAILYDDKGKKIAKIMEFFGPVDSPYISAVPLTDRINKIIGKKVYNSRSISEVAESKK